MSRAQERSTGDQSGAQATQRTTGNVPGQAGNTSAEDFRGQSGTTSGTSMQGQPGTTGAARSQGAGTRAGATSTALQDDSTARADRGQDAYAEPGYGTGAGTSTLDHSALGGAMTILAGLLVFFTGLAAIERASLYHVAGNYLYSTGVHTWGWILFGLGIALVLAGALALFGMTIARYIAVVLAVFAGIAGFMYLPYTPIWGIILVAVSVFAIWGLLRPGDQPTRSSRI